MNGMPRLIIVCGLPGSGKTTHARQLEADLGGVRFSADDWMTALAINLHDESVRARIEALQWTVCQQLLAKDLITIVEWGTWGRWERDILRTRAREFGATVELHYLSVPEDVLFNRIQKRGMEDPPIKREDVSAWWSIFEAPTEEEKALFDSVELHGGEA